MELKSNRNILTSILFAVYMLLLIGVVIFKLPFYSPKLSDGIRVINLIPFQGSFDENGGLLAREIIYNILLFIPFGTYISMLKADLSFIKKVLAVISLTLIFEGIQYAFAIGRSDITDVINNTLGGIIGIAIYAILFKIFKDKTIKVVNISALMVTILVSARFAYLFYLSNIMMRSLPPLT